MSNVSAASVAEVWDAIKKFDGVPQWWAELFVNVGFNAVDALTWVQTASCDASSPLSVARERDLNVTLKGYATARGISLLGVGDGEDVVNPKADKLIHWVSTITTPEEQEVISREVSGYAEVRFREKCTGVYTAHGVANAVRSVHQAYQRKTYGNNTTVLEAGASLKSAVLAGVDVRKYHCCCPVLDVRDSVRHSLRGWLSSVAAEDGGYNESQRAAAIAALDPSSGFVCRRTAQDCSKQVEVICSNESTHDVAFNDLPKIMARHGARLWMGFMTRAPGARRNGGPTSGQCKVFGTRWKLDRSSDRITFHFAKDSSFSYAHRFSEWISYDEKFGYRWRGRYFDYVYTRLPITTSASLAFVVVRVPRAMTMLREPVYKASDLAGQVKVTSIRAVGGCVGGAKPKFEPCTFTMEALVFDRVLETRLSQGDRGNLASTLAYMRSARVRLVLGGVSLGAVMSVPVEVLEPAAVAVEILAADCRRAGERDFNAIYEASLDSNAVSNVVGYFSGLSRFVTSAGKRFEDMLRNALCNVANRSSQITVAVEKCPNYVRVDDGSSVGIVKDVPSLSVTSCGCNELASVKAALLMGKALTAAEKKELTVYAAKLEEAASVCTDHVESIEMEDAPDVFYDAEEPKSLGSVASLVDFTETSSRSSAFDSSARSTSISRATLSSVTSVDESTGDWPEAVGKDGPVVSAMREYARWAKISDDCSRSEARSWYDVLFQLGPPTKEDVERSTTARTRHAVVAVINGRIEKQVGSLREDDTFAEIYVRSLNRTTKVHVDAVGKKYIAEPLNELCYTGTDLKVMNGEALSRNVYRILADLPVNYSIPRYTYVKGVPGSGKTYEIVQRIVADIAIGRFVIYLTATTASKDKVLEDVARIVGREESFIAKTYDSYIINGAAPAGNRSFDFAYFDEAAMVHKGQLFACIAKITPLNAMLYGDPEQLPWLSFMSSFEPKLSRIDSEFRVETRNMTHRFGVGTCAMWLDVYDSIYPCTCHEHDETLPEVIKITSAASVPRLDTGKVLTFTQEEKNNVKREMSLTKSLSVLKVMDKGGLSTVGEDQGGTHEDVSIVRLVNKKNPKESSISPSIYNRQPWVLVATTRHVRYLKYYTTAEDDLVTARIALASCLVRRSAVEKRKKWSDVSDKAMKVRVFGV